jgi:hypothetical protein
LSILDPYPQTLNPSEMQIRVLSAAHDATVQRLEQQIRSLEIQVAEGGGADKRRLKELSEKCVAAEVEVSIRFSA